VLQFGDLTEMMSKLRSAISHLIKSEGHGSRKSNSATDCDDLMANSIPYRLLLVNAANHSVCAKCPWDKLCTGCRLDEDDLDKVLDAKNQVIVHWETIALHFRYQEPARTVCNDLQDGGRDFNVINCLKMLEQPEKIDEWKCEKCNESCQAMKQLVPYRFPPILVIHLKRFELNMINMRWMKCSRHIKAQTELEINDAYHEKNLQYKLYAAIIHQGSLDGGHYTALCKRGQKWILFNDDHITEIDVEKLAEYLNNAYVLFYERYCDFEKEIEPSIILSQYRDTVSPQTAHQLNNNSMPKDNLKHKKDNSSCMIQ